MSERTKELVEAVERLAEEIVGVEPDDLQDLANIHARFQKIASFEALCARHADMARACADKVEGVILREFGDPDAEIARINQAVAALQEIAEALDQDRSADGCRLPAWFDSRQNTVERSEAKYSGGPELEFDEIPPDTDDALLNEFIAESLDHLQNAEAALLAIESGGESEKINEIFRAFHTIKGTSGFLGLACINKLAHKAETLLDQARKGEVELTGDYADLAFDSCDSLKTLIEYVGSRARGAATAKPTGLNALMARLDNIDAEPVLQVPRIGDLLVAEGKVSREALEEVLNDKSAAGRLGERLIQKALVRPKDIARALRAQEAARAKLVGESSVRVNTSRLDMLINMVGELVIAQSMVAQDEIVHDSGSQTLVRKVGQLEKITRELQELGLSLRMVPLKNTFQKMARLVRDLSRKSGKDVRLLTEGEETEIDRNMVEAISDPLVHIMRNAVDHGIEDAETRATARKDTTGVITLRAFHSAGSVVIEIIDDGGGLDRAAILRRAVERGMVEKGREHEIADSEVFNLILQPGFSTAKEVTAVSGRGVGMDVVKRNVERLRGKLEITSQHGTGSSFAMRLPLTLAIIDGMLLHVGAQRYILPTINIREAVRPQADMISTLKGRGEMLSIRDRLVPIVRLHKLFGVEGARTDIVDGLLVILEIDDKLCALLIDEIIGQQQVVIKSLGGATGKTPGISGGAILGDGKVGLILDAPNLVAFAQKSATNIEGRLVAVGAAGAETGEQYPENNA